MSGRLQGKRCFITAAAQGMGRACAEAFATEGAQVIATDVNAKKLSELTGTPGIETAELSVLDADAVAAAAARYGPVDVLFNCAGFVHQGTLLDSTEADWDTGFDLNVKSMWRVTRAFLPAMIDNGGGSIINMASVSGSVKGIVQRCVYGSTKAAVIGFTKSVAADYVTQGIRCNALAPGTVDTPSLQDRINTADDPDAARKAFVARQPMGRLATAQEIVPLAVYLASNESTFVTGQVHIIDGGIVM